MLRMNTVPLEPVGRATRREIIKQCRAGTAPSHFVMFRGRYVEMPVVRIPAEALVYRFDNGRLATELRERAARGRLSLAEMRAVAEAADTQRLLHELLIEKARNPAGPIYQELERERQQTEPLLITADGVVVNGNRRLAAMRELLSGDAQRYAAFGEVLASVLLDDATPEEIEYSEAALQMAPDTKLAYGWLERRLKLRQQRDVLKLPVAKLQAAYRIQQASQIADEIAELALAEAYLAEFRGEPERYSLLADAEKLFVGLRSRLADLPAAKRGLWRLVGFVLVDGRAGIDAVERLFPFAPPEPVGLPSLAAARLAERFAEGASGSRRGAARRDIEALLADPRHSRAHARIIADVLDELRLEGHERQAPERMLKKVRDAGKAIAAIEPERLSASQRRRLRSDLAALQAQGAYVLGEAKGEQPGPGRWSSAKPILRPPYWKVPRRLIRRIGWSKDAMGKPRS